MTNSQVDNNSMEDVLRFEVAVEIEDVDMGSIEEGEFDLAVMKICQMAGTIRESEDIRQKYAEEFLVTLVNDYPDLVSKVETAIESGMNKARVEKR